MSKGITKKIGSKKVHFESKEAVRKFEAYKHIHGIAKKKR